MSKHSWPPLDPPPEAIARPAKLASEPVLAAAVIADSSAGAGYVAASLWRRTLATLLDALVPLTAWVLGTLALVGSDPEPLALPPWNLFDQLVDYLHDRPGRSALSFLLLFGLQIAWPVIFAARTPGRQTMDIALLDGAGRSPSRVRCLAWAPWRVPSLALAGLGLWWALIDPERRTLHDRLAGLWLVRRSPPPDARRS